MARGRRRAADRGQKDARRHEVEARLWACVLGCDGFERRFSAFDWSSGQCGFGQPQDVVRLSGRGRETIVFRPEAGDLELQSLHPGTQSGDLVE